MDPSVNPLLDWAEVSLAEVSANQDEQCERCGVIDDDVMWLDDCTLCDPAPLCRACTTHRWAECAEKHQGAA